MRRSTRVRANEAMDQMGCTYAPGGWATMVAPPGFVFAAVHHGDNHTFDADNEPGYILTEAEVFRTVLDILEEGLNPCLRRKCPHCKPEK